MKVVKNLIAGSTLALVALGASAAYLNGHVGESFPAATTAMKADEAVPQNLVTAMKANEGVPQNLVTAMKADEGVPQNLVTAMNADEGVPQNMVTREG